MRIEAIIATGEMGRFKIIQMNDQSVGVYREGSGESLITNSLDGLAVAIDGVNFQDTDSAFEIAQILAVKLEGM